MAAMQLDTRNPMAPVLVPYLMRQLMTSQYYADGQRLLVDWDYSQPADSAAAAYFNVVWSNVLRLTFHDQLPEPLWPDGGSRWMAVVTNLLRQPESQWWDDASTPGVVEDRDMVLAQAMRTARDELTRRESVSPERWTWGRLHRLELENQSVGQSDIGLVRALFNRGPFDVGGGTASVDATSWNAARGTPSPRRRRCGWWSTSTTSTARAGSTSPARRATWPRATTATRPRCGSTAARWPGRSRATRSAARRRAPPGAPAPKRVRPSSVTTAVTERSWSSRGTEASTSSEFSSTQMKVPTGTRPSARS